MTEEKFRCGGTGWVRDKTYGRMRKCFGCSDCATCHGTKQRWNFEAVMVGPNQQASCGGPLFSLSINPCPGCPDCKPQVPPTERYAPPTPEELKQLREQADEGVQLGHASTGETEARVAGTVGAYWAARLARALDLLERATDERDRQTAKLLEQQETLAMHIRRANEYSKGIEAAIGQDRARRSSGEPARSDRREIASMRMRLEQLEKR